MYTFYTSFEINYLLIDHKTIKLASSMSSLSLSPSLPPSLPPLPLSLPLSLPLRYLGDNDITNLSSNSFSRLHKLTYL